MTLVGTTIVLLHSSMPWLSLDLMPIGASLG